MTEPGDGRRRWRRFYWVVLLVGGLLFVLTLTVWDGFGSPLEALAAILMMVLAGWYLLADHRARHRGS